MRQQLQDKLYADGIGTLVHYPIPPHRQEAYYELGFSSGDFPLAEKMASETLSLPIGPHMDAMAVDRVIMSVNALIESV